MIEGLKPYPKMKDSGLPWCPHVPAHWDLVPNRAFLNQRKVLVGEKHSDYTLLSLTKQGVIVRDISENKGKFSADMGTSQEVRKGNLVMCLFDVPETPRTIGLSRHTGMITSAYTVFEVRDDQAANWLEAFYISMDDRKLLSPLYSGLRHTIPKTRFLSTHTPLPAANERAAIIRFLTHADGRIRQLIRSKQRLVALLEEQKHTIIHHAVTRGLDPSVRLRASGVPWLGKIPEHWEVRRSKRLFAPRKELARPGDIQLAATQAFGVIGQDDYEKKVGRKIVKIFRHLEKRRHVELDDFVISMRSFQGGLERAWQSGCIRSSYVVLRPLVVIDVGYFSRLFKSPGYIRALQSTADFIRDGQDLNYENFCSVDIPFPPVGEQRAISQMLDTILSRTAVLTERTAEEVLFLKEFRTRLISDVVTGRLDVRDAAARLPAEDLEGDDPLDDTDTDGEEDDDSPIESGAEDGDGG